jgi:hypothetical protein
MKNMPVMERFMEKVDKRGPKECWPFMSSIGKSGCGRFFYHGQCRDAYKIGYELLVGPIPEDKHLHHICENRRCVNPAHLEVVSVRDHFVNRSPKHITYINSRKTHCPQGHPLVDGNLVKFRQNKNQRVCLICTRKRVRECQQRRRKALAN